jgi:hypothetical protein
MKFRKVKINDKTSKEENIGSQQIAIDTSLMLIARELDCSQTAMDIKAQIMDITASLMNLVPLAINFHTDEDAREVFPIILKQMHEGIANFCDFLETIKETRKDAH